ncbi:nucleotidyltransferase [Entophlyctis luteolus]|nr:nucleotidyltransferase [Entophlyctis luteolus]
MEEGVINQVLASPLRTLFSDDQIVSSNSGSGNNWAVGYATYGASHGQAIEEALRIQAEQCDSLQAFFLLSSLGGGTGSGLGSFVIELLADCYPDVYRFSVPVCPSEDDDVVTSPYNTMLSLAKLIESADCVLPVENQALIDICNKISPAKSRDPNAQKANSSVTIIDSGTKPYGGLCAGTRKKLPFDEMNNIVANLILNVTASMRFEGSMNVDINDIVTNLVPFPQQKFLFSSMTPLTVSADRAQLKRPKTAQQLCKDCFYAVFETEIHNTIVSARLFRPGDRVAIAASGGKDSTVLAHTMKLLNERYNYGLDLVLLSIDEGIKGYRDDSLDTVKRNQVQYGLPLLIVSYEELYGWSMDKIVAQIGTKNNCTFCGVFRRQALDRGAARLKVDHIVTGHNADDVAETVLMNLFRGDFARLVRCTQITTRTLDSGSDDSPQYLAIPRSKPFKYTYEKEIVMYAYFKQLDYFSTECTYAVEAYRGHARVFLKDLEKVRPSAVMDIVHSGEAFGEVYASLPEDKQGTKVKKQGVCERCGYIASNKLCKACVLLETLNKGRASVDISLT